jgi:outer membrane protein OmpA-like peptidoglycan-associated protein
MAALGACGGGGDKKQAADPSPQLSASPAGTAVPNEPLATAESSVSDSDYGGIRFDLMSLNRVGDAVVAQIRLVGVADDEVSIGSNLLGGSWTKTPPGGFSDVSGFALADAAERRLYTPLRETSGDCVCTDTDALDEAFLSKDETVTVYAAFPAPPADTETVTVVNPLGPPFPPVEIQDGDPPRIDGADELPDLASLALGEPVVLPIRSLADALDKSRSVAESDREVDIRLSTDVLFAINSAKLSPRSRAILREVAGELEQADATAVRLEGHADSTGTDAINDPLSRRRALSVAAALKSLVGGDVRFTARGYGSRRPVASNDAPEGRRRNRRVSVIFTRPPHEDVTAPEDSGGTGGQAQPAGGKTVDVEGRVATAGQKVTVELESLRADGPLAVLSYTVTNSGDENANLSSLLGSGLDDTYRFARQALTGPSLVDRAARQRYFVADVPVAGDDICLCSDDAGAHLGMGTLEPGEEGRYYAVYAVPQTAQAVTVEFGPKATLPAIAVDRQG